MSFDPILEAGNGVAAPEPAQGEPATGPEDNDDILRSVLLSASVLSATVLGCCSLDSLPSDRIEMTSFLSLHEVVILKESTPSTRFAAVARTTTAGSNPSKFTRTERTALSTFASSNYFPANSSVYRSVQVVNLVLTRLPQRMGSKRATSNMGAVVCHGFDRIRSGHCQHISPSGTLTMLCRGEGISQP